MARSLKKRKKKEETVTLPSLLAIWPEVLEKACQQRFSQEGDNPSDGDGNKDVKVFIYCPWGAEYDPVAGHYLSNAQ